MRHIKSSAVWVCGLAFLWLTAIWLFLPYSNYIVRSESLADSYLPLCLVIPLFVVVCFVNPVLGRLAPSLRLGRRQLILFCAVVLMGAVVPGSGLLRLLPYGLARQAQNALEWSETATLYGEAALPPGLFPVALGYQSEAPEARWFLLQLPEGQGIPWEAWTGPALSWGLLLACYWAMMAGLAGIVFPQWQAVERIPFPLVTILRGFIGREDGKAPVLFQRRGFWIASGIVFAVHVFYGLSLWYPEDIPQLPLYTSLAPLFKAEPLSYMPSYIKYFRIYFLFIGIAYFMPTRIGFSVWFFMILYAFYAMLGQIYRPPFNHAIPGDQRTGAIIALSLWIVWLGRRRWFEVARNFAGRVKAHQDGTSCGGSVSAVSVPRFVWAAALVLMVLLVWGAGVPPSWAALGVLAGLWLGAVCRGGGSAEVRRDRVAAGLFLGGAIGMMAWLMWAGVQAPWSVVLVGIAFVYALVVTRLVAETGLPFFGLSGRHFVSLISLAPVHWVSHTTSWFIGACGTVFGSGTRVCAATTALHAVALDEETDPRRTRNLLLGMVPLLAAGFLIAGLAHLHTSYTHGASLGWNPDQPVNEAGTNSFGEALSTLTQRYRERWDVPQYNAPMHIALGAALAGGLQYASLLAPRWPLHPLGMILAYTSYGSYIWASVLMGWLVRVVMVGLGGAQLYSQGRPIVLGLIFGELSAAAFWFVANHAVVWASGNIELPVQIFP